MHSEIQRREGCIIKKDLLKRLYQTYYKEIYIYIYSMCKRSDLAEDLTQDTFLKALLSLSNSHTNARAWLYTVARNLLFNHMKKEKKLTDISELDFCDAAEPDGLISDIIKKEETRALYNALEHLSQTKKEILLIHYFGGLPQKEIAAVLGLTPANVRVLTLRAKQEIKQYMEVNSDDIS